MIKIVEYPEEVQKSLGSVRTVEQPKAAKVVAEVKDVNLEVQKKKKKTALKKQEEPEIFQPVKRQIILS